MDYNNQEYNDLDEAYIDKIKSEPFLIQYNKNPSEELQLIVVNISCYNIKYINEPTKKVQQEAVKQSYETLLFIKNPFEEIIETALDSYFSDPYFTNNFGYYDDYFDRHLKNLSLNKEISNELKDKILKIINMHKVLNV